MSTEKGQTPIIKKMNYHKARSEEYVKPFFSFYHNILLWKYLFPIQPQPLEELLKLVFFNSNVCGVNV